MNVRDWKYQIKNTCVDAGVYYPYCDRSLDLLADLMYTWKDFCNQYDKAKKENDFEKMNTCAIRKADLHQKCINGWKELMLTPKAYYEFLDGMTESNKQYDPVLDAFEKFENG